MASAWAQGAGAAGSANDKAQLQLDRQLEPLASRRAGAPAYIRADRLSGTADESALAEGQVEFRRGGVVLRAERVEYRAADRSVHASGQVTILQGGSVYRGPELQFGLDTQRGWFDQPQFDFPALGSGGRARRVEFLGEQRSRAVDALYTSCPRDGGGEPAWLLKTDRIDLDFAANEGVAEGAVLRFLGVPVLAAPKFSFPISSQRKSGWLPPNLNIDNRSGVDFSIPYYWNIAPNRDATLTPRLLTRRGVGADLEFRYLEPGFQGSVGLDLLPYDRVAERLRFAWRAEHEGPLGAWVPGLDRARYGWQAIRVSDDDWWKDFPRSTASITPRLLSREAWMHSPWSAAGVQGSVYGRLSHWQVLQSAEAIVKPYQRSPQVGIEGRTALAGGADLEFNSELNRFTLPHSGPADAGLPQGVRWHGQATLSRPWREPGWWVVPAVAWHATAWDTSGRPSAVRSLPTFSVDAGATFERHFSFQGLPLRQLLEPRLRYVRTPFRDQSGLPNYDAAGKDFNFTSIYSDNAWSGVDRISDSHQLTFGATTRVVREADGAEILRLGLVQRLLLDPQRVTPDDANPTQIAATPSSRRLSDVLLVGSTTVLPRWTLEGSVRYNADTQRAVRSVLSARYSGGDFRTVNTSYRFTRGQAEQIDVGWQWPLARVGSGGCRGRLYGVGRVNYSMMDSRITDSLLGLEYDAGCWIGRIVAERVSTGRTEANTRLMLQLELVGLSRLGSNPLRVLKDNIPGYRLLREERTEASTPSPFHD